MIIASHPRVSIGLPVYNGEQYLGLAVDSLLRQTFGDFELIISDNCSSDRTQQICEELTKRDPRVRYHRTDQNVGAAANFNRVVELATGDLFAWANHDDLYAETYLEKCIEALDRTPGAVSAYAQSIKIDPDGAQISPMIFGFGLEETSPSRRLFRYHEAFREIDRRKGWSEEGIEGLWMPVYGLIRADYLKKTGLIGTYISSDTVLIEELLMSGMTIEINEPLFFKRDHPGRSMKASIPYNERLTWFSGRAAGRFLFPRWRIFFERLTAVNRAPLPFGSRLRCHGEMLIFYVRRPHEGKALVKELIINAWRLIAGARGRARAPQKW